MKSLKRQQQKCLPQKVNQLSAITVLGLFDRPRTTDTTTNIHPQELQCDRLYCIVKKKNKPYRCSNAINVF